MIESVVWTDPKGGIPIEDTKQYIMEEYNKSEEEAEN